MPIQAGKIININKNKQSLQTDSLQIEYVLNIPGRARIRIQVLKGNTDLCLQVSGILSRISGVLSVEANPFTAKLLIVYDCSRITVQELESSLSTAFHSEKKRKPEMAKVIKANFKYNRILTPEEFIKCRNTLSKGYRELNLKAFEVGTAGVDEELLWYDIAAEETEELLRTDMEKGLSREEAKRRLKDSGLNKLDKSEKKSFLSMLFNQFDGFMVKMLLAASGVSLLLGQVLDAVTIMGIIGVEALIGIWQQYKSEKSLDLLRHLAAPSAAVMRDGIKYEIPAEELVAGDIIYLEAGNVVTADARLIESNGLQAVEASLTGEAYPVYKKSTDILSKNTPLGDRSNMVYMGTSIVKGNGKAIVTATGMHTEMGRIAGMLSKSDSEKTPLQKDLGRLAKFVTLGSLGICGVITFLGLLGGNPILETFSTGVSLAVSAIPEGLTTVLAISLAFGAQRLAKKSAIVKSLPAMETLSCTKVICTDKTGTLTKNEMTVKGIYTMNKKFNVLGEGYHSRGSLIHNGIKVTVEDHSDLKTLLTAAALCNNAQIKPIGNKFFKINGDPTEAALLIAVEKSEVKPDEFNCYKRDNEIPFDSETKKMTVVCSDKDGKYFTFVKGAIDNVLSNCTKVMSGDEIQVLSEQHLVKIHEANRDMTAKAWRVLALAYKPHGDNDHPVDSPAVEQELIFLGLVGIMDPPRPEVRNAIKKCHAAGIKVVMITGDHKNTAAAIAKSIGLLTERGVVLSSEDIEHLSEEELSEIIENVEVFARSCPAQKLKIVKALKRKGYIVAMTGDGVNDAPALKEAHIGIAMGHTGTDVAKDASSIILTDDNFNTVVKAVEEGRTVNRNIKKFMKYVLSGNLAEVFSIFLASIAGIPSPLIPAQILLLNLVTEGIPALSLGVDPPEDNIMNEPPRDPNASVFDHKLKTGVISRGVATGLTTLGIFGGALFLTRNLLKARTMAFANLASCQMLHAFECSSMGVKRNKHLMPAVAISSGIMLASIYILPLAGIFSMVPLNILDWCAILLSGIALSRIDDFLKNILSMAKVHNSKYKSTFHFIR